MNLKVGDFVLVSAGFDNGSQWSFKNYGGRVEQIIDDEIIQVIWDSVTLNKFSNEYIKWMAENDNYLFDYKFAEDELILAEPRDTIENVYDVQETTLNKKIELVGKKDCKVEHLYDYFVITPFYNQLTIIQKNYSWSIIETFSSVMLDNNDVYPDDWTKDEFIYAYENEFIDNAFADNDFRRSTRKVLLHFVEFLDAKSYIDTKEIQEYLKNS